MQNPGLLTLCQCAITGFGSRYLMLVLICPSMGFRLGHQDQEPARGQEVTPYPRIVSRGASARVAVYPSEGVMALCFGGKAPIRDVKRRALSRCGLQYTRVIRRVIGLISPARLETPWA